MKDLINLGWCDFFEQQLEAKDESLIGRVVVAYRGAYQVKTEGGEYLAELSGKFRWQGDDKPALGDWVQMEQMPGTDRARITGTLERKSKLSRNVAGQTTEEQLIAANVDTVFIATSSNQDLNLRRLERYMAQVWEGGMVPVILITKADLVSDVSELVAEVHKVAPFTDVIAISAKEGDGLENLSHYLKPSTTSVLVGSSGVGKSTLVNHLLKREAQKVLEIREADAKGRHTTTVRRLFLLSNGACLIDTPGMRELQLWGGSEGVSQAFEDIESLFQYCKFSNCSHQNDEGCAVEAAIGEGKLSEGRWENYSKLLREAQFHERKHDKKAMSLEKKKWKRIFKAQHVRTKMKGRY